MTLNVTPLHDQEERGYSPGAPTPGWVAQTGALL